MPRRGGFRDGRAAKCTLVGGSESRAAGAHLRSEMPRIRGVFAIGAGDDRTPTAAGGRGMSADRPAKGLGMGLQALLGEAARPMPAPGTADAPASRGGVRDVD